MPYSIHNVQPGWGRAVPDNKPFGEKYFYKWWVRFCENFGIRPTSSRFSQAINIRAALSSWVGYTFTGIRQASSQPGQVITFAGDAGFITPCFIKALKAGCGHAFTFLCPIPRASGIPVPIRLRISLMRLLFGCKVLLWDEYRVH